MRRLKKRFRFEAAHHLEYYEGNCHREHGHSYQFEIEVYGPVATEGPNQQMTLDYAIIGKAGKRIIKLLDHQNLNKILFTNSPTAEFISKWIFDSIQKRVPYLWAVTVCETEATSCRYSPGEEAIYGKFRSRELY